MNSGEPMVQYQEFGITTRHFISNGNLHRNSKTKTVDLLTAITGKFHFLVRSCAIRIESWKKGNPIK